MLCAMQPRVLRQVPQGTIIPVLPILSLMQSLHKPDPSRTEENEAADILDLREGTGA